MPQPVNGVSFSGKTYRGYRLIAILLEPWASFDNIKKKLSKLFGGLAWRRSEHLSTFFFMLTNLGACSDPSLK